MRLYNLCISQAPANSSSLYACHVHVQVQLDIPSTLRSRIAANTDRNLAFSYLLWNRVVEVELVNDLNPHALLS